MGDPRAGSDAGGRVRDRSVRNAQEDEVGFVYVRISQIFSGLGPEGAAAQQVFKGFGETDVKEATRLVDISLDAGMMYFDARLSAHAPTVEVRIADVCFRPDDAAALAMLVRALVTWAAAAAADGEPPDPVPTSLLRLASWRKRDAR